MRVLFKKTYIEGIEFQIMVYSQGSVILKGKDAFSGSKFSMLDAAKTQPERE